MREIEPVSWQSTDVAFVAFHPLPVYSVDVVTACIIAITTLVCHCQGLIAKVMAFQYSLQLSSHGYVEHTADFLKFFDWA